MSDDLRREWLAGKLAAIEVHLDIDGTRCDKIRSEDVRWLIAEVRELDEALSPDWNAAWKRLEKTLAAAKAARADSRHEPDVRNVDTPHTEA